MSAENPTLRIAILDDYQRIALEIVDWSDIKRRSSVTVFSDTITDPDALVARLQPFHVLCVMRERTPLPGSIIRRLPLLELVVSTGPKNTSIDHETAAARGVVVKDTRGSLTAPIELTWALIQASARRLPMEAARLRAGFWQGTVGNELKGQTLGVLGLGRIGTKIAEIARLFEMDVVTWSERVTRDEASKAGATLVTKDQLFALSDVLSIHLVLVEATRGLVGPNELAQMKRTAWLVNTSRGPIVDEAALVSALRKQEIGGAALDVFETEPVPADAPILSAPNTILTPHPRQRRGHASPRLCVPAAIRSLV